MADVDERPADDRWLVIDERRLRYIIFDTRLMADRTCKPVDRVVFAAVAWHTNMRAIEAVEMPHRELAAYAKVSAKSIERSLARLRSYTADETADGEAVPGYIYKVDRPGQTDCYGLHDHAGFPTPRAHTPWSTSAPLAEALDPAEQLAFRHRWIGGLAGMRHVIEFDTRLLIDTLLDDYAISAYLGITWHIGYRGAAFPKLSRLATLTGIGETRLAQALAELCAAGYLERTQRPGKTTVYSALPLDRLPIPPGWSPWSTTDRAEDVPPDQARANKSKARGPLTDAEDAMARAWGIGTDPGTTDRDEGVLSTGAAGDDEVSSTTTDSADAGHGLRRGRSSNTPTPHPPTPQAGSPRPRTPSRPESRQSRSSRVARALRDTPRDPKARDLIQTTATRRALLIVENWRTQLLAGDVELEMLADRVRADCRRAQHARSIDIEAVVTTALLAAQVLIDTNGHRGEISPTNPPTTEA